MVTMRGVSDGVTTLPQRSVAKSDMNAKIMAVFIQLFFLARDINHKTCTMHSHTCTNIHTLSVLKLTGMLV